MDLSWGHCCLTGPFCPSAWGLQWLFSWASLASGARKQACSLSLWIWLTGLFERPRCWRVCSWTCLASEWCQPVPRACHSWVPVEPTLPYSVTICLLGGYGALAVLALSTPPETRLPNSWIIKQSVSTWIMTQLFSCSSFETSPTGKALGNW